MAVEEWLEAAKVVQRARPRGVCMAMMKLRRCEVDDVICSFVRLQDGSLPRSGDEGAGERGDLLRGIISSVKRRDRRVARLELDRPNQFTGGWIASAMRVCLDSAWALLVQRVLCFEAGASPELEMEAEGLVLRAFRSRRVHDDGEPRVLLTRPLPTRLLCTPRCRQLLAAMSSHGAAEVEGIRSKLADLIESIDGHLALHYSSRNDPGAAAAALLPLYMLHGAERWRRALDACSRCAKYVADLQRRPHETRALSSL